VGFAYRKILMTVRSSIDPAPESWSPVTRQDFFFSIQIIPDPRNIMCDMPRIQIRKHIVKAQTMLVINHGQVNNQVQNINAQFWRPVFSNIRHLSKSISHAISSYQLIE